MAGVAKAGMINVFTATVCAALALMLWCPGSRCRALEAAGTHVLDIEESSLFPFAVNARDVWPNNVTNVAHWLDKPAGRDGFVITKDGHFYTEGGQRLRFLGVNICWGGAFPEHDEAAELARRLARFGINLVRFHDIERYEAPDGIWQRGSSPRRIDPVQLDKLDYFVAQLKENGIYVNFNLKVNRRYLPEEGFAAGSPPVTYKGLDLFYPAAIEAQKQYARELLTHRNPYTGLAYINEPVLAQIELVNEDSLFYVWQRDELDRLPGTYLASLDQLWLAWLKGRYGTTAALRRAWGGAATHSGKGQELLGNGDFHLGTTGWKLHQSGVGAAEMMVIAAGPKPRDEERIPALQIEVKSRAGVALSAPLDLSPGEVYRLYFWAKADRPGHRLIVGAEAGATVGPAGVAVDPAVPAETSSPPGDILWREEITLSADWRQYSFKFRTAAGAEAAAHAAAAALAGRLVFAMPANEATFFLAGISVRSEGSTAGLGLLEGEGLETGVSRPTHNDFLKHTAQVQEDYIAFLYHVEEAYFQEMYTYIKEELGARSLVAGTQVPLSPSAVQAQLDYIDVHKYWGHPQFPGGSWDGQNWYFNNNTMVNAEGGTIADLAGLRVAGKPYVVSEYNHPVPNTYGVEGLLLAGAYGAFQDWDGIVVFDWTSNRRYDAGQLTNHFNIKSHPLKLVTLPAVAAMFTRGDVAPGETVVFLPLSREEQLGLMAERTQTSVAHRAWSRAMPAQLPLTHRVARLLTDEETEAGKAEAGPASGAGLTAVKSVTDTGELLWDRSAAGAGVVVVNTARSSAVIGYGEGRTFALPHLTLKPGPTLQDGWSAITYTVMEESESGPVRALLTATGYCQNTGMQWQSLGEGRFTLRNWGSGPVLVEGVPAEVALETGKKVRVYALDAAGYRLTEVPVIYTHAAGAGPDGGDARLAVAQFAIGPQYRTLWYEIEFQ